MSVETITLGVVTFNSAGDLAASAGVAAIPGDMQSQAAAVAEHLNGEGGGAGRAYDLVFYDYNAASDDEVNGQAACSAFTEDAQVFAAVSMTSLGESFHGCMRDRGVPVVTAIDRSDEEWQDTFPILYQPSDVNLTRVGRALAQALHSQGFYDGGWERAGSTETRIGLVRTSDVRAERASDQGLQPALAALGLELAAEFDAGSIGQDANAVLQFRAAGITHVLFLVSNPVVFAQAAEQQGYRPRYGLDSRQSMGTVTQDTMPPEQMVGTMGVGWNPSNDVDAARDPGPVNDNQVVCDAVMREHGEDMDNRVTRLSALSVCDSMFFIDVVVDSATALGPGGFQTAAEALGGRYASPLTFRTSFGPGLRHDGVAAWRPVAFLEECGCFSYTGEPRELPR